MIAFSLSSVMIITTIHEPWKNKQTKRNYIWRTDDVDITRHFLLFFKMAESFENSDNIVRECAED